MAVIREISSTTVGVIEQNNSPTGYNSYPRTEAACFLTAGATPTGPACSGTMYGPYCGSDEIIDGRADTLYWCRDGAVLNSTVCTNSAGDGFCETMPSGTYDRCVPGSCAGKVDGYFCGNDGLGGAANGLYFCSGGKITSAVDCPLGCEIRAGENDICKS